MISPIGRSTYDSSKRELIGPSKKRKLPRGIHKFMMCLIKKPNEMVPKEELLATFSGNENQLRVYATRLRIIFKIVDPSLTVENKYRKGYMLKV